MDEYEKDLTIEPYTEEIVDTNPQSWLDWRLIDAGSEAVPTAYSYEKYLERVGLKASPSRYYWRDYYE